MVIFVAMVVMQLNFTVPTFSNRREFFHGLRFGSVKKPWWIWLVGTSWSEMLCSAFVYIWLLLLPVVFYINLIMIGQLNHQQLSFSKERFFLSLSLFWNNMFTHKFIKILFWTLYSHMTYSKIRMNADGYYTTSSKCRNMMNKKCGRWASATMKFKNPRIVQHDKKTALFF